jgi:hypothetical protein
MYMALCVKMQCVKMRSSSGSQGCEHERCVRNAGWTRRITLALPGLAPPPRLRCWGRALLCLLCHPQPRHCPVPCPPCPSSQALIQAQSTAPFMTGRSRDRPFDRGRSSRLAFVRCGDVLGMKHGGAREHVESLAEHGGRRARRTLRLRGRGRQRV